MKNLADLIIENKQLKSKANQLEVKLIQWENINKSNCIGAIKQIYKMDKEAAKILKGYSEQLKEVQNDEMSLNASYALLKQEIERLKVKLEKRRLQ